MFVESFDLNFIPRNKFLVGNNYKVLKVVNIIFSVFFFFHISFIADKDYKIKASGKKCKLKRLQIADLAATNKELSKKIVIIQDLVQNKVKEIIDLAEQKSPLFSGKISAVFPDFIPPHFLILIQTLFLPNYKCVH